MTNKNQTPLDLNKVDEQTLIQRLKITPRLAKKSWLCVLTNPSTSSIKYGGSMRKRYSESWGQSPYKSKHPPLYKAPKFYRQLQHPPRKQI